MSFKIAVIGAGSIGFTRAVIRDILSVKKFADIEISLMDINENNLDMSYQLLKRDIEHNKLTSVKLVKTLDRDESLTNAKYILVWVRHGGLEAFEMDVDIPLQYGVDQCVGDTLCAGGIMYGQRGIAFMLDLCKDIKKFADKDALLLNYANPNAMMTWAANEYGDVPTIGLCHGVQHGSEDIAKALNIEHKELDYTCAGINHQTWYIQLLHKGREITAEELLTAYENHEELSKREKVRIDILKRFGYFSTESNGHLSEYLAWYRKRPEEINDWIELGNWIDGETAGYLRVCKESWNWFETDFPEWMKKPPFEYAEKNRSSEHASWIIEALETGTTYRGHFNVMNKGYITNIPQTAVVEVPGYVDANGISIPVVGDLPLGCAAVCSQSIYVQHLAVQAAVEGNVEKLKQAMLLDPLVGAVCNPPEVWQMVDDMLIAQKQWLPQYKEKIAKIEKEQKNKQRIPLKNYKGAARIEIRSVDEIRKEQDVNRPIS